MQSDQRTEGDSLLLTHGRDDGDEEVLSVIESLLDLVAELSLRKADVVLGSSIRSHHVKETIVDYAEER